MNKYTVVLLRPDYLTSEYGTDIYVAYVKERDTKAALAAAQWEVFDADEKAAKFVEDYTLCVMFEGHPKTIMYGWML